MSQFDSIKKEVGPIEQCFGDTKLIGNVFQRETAEKSELFASATSPSAGSARQRFTNGPARSSAPPELIGESPYRSATPNGTTMPDSTLDREAYALREHSFAQNASAQLDDFLAQGREVLDSLVDQRNMLKGTQRRLLDAANTLGLSRNVINWIERRR